MGDPGYKITSPDPLNEIKLMSDTSKTKKRVAVRPEKPRTQEQRQLILDAAAHVVGKHGYASASVSKICSKAKIAQGTFYYYFNSQQDLFDQLLPAVGRKMTEELTSEIGEYRNEFERECRRARAVFEYNIRHPEFYRILSEAELFTPRAFEEHFSVITEDYRNSLAKGRVRGEMSEYTPEEMEALPYILMASRTFLIRHFIRKRNLKEVPPWLLTAYLKFVAHGLGFGPLDSDSIRAIQDMITPAVSEKPTKLPAKRAADAPRLRTARRP